MNEQPATKMKANKNTVFGTKRMNEKMKEQTEMNEVNAIHNEERKNEENKDKNKQ